MLENIAMLLFLADKDDLRTDLTVPRARVKSREVKYTFHHLFPALLKFLWYQ